MNSIPTDQNREIQLDRLAAQRKLYADAKGVFGWQFTVGGPVAIIVSLLVASLSWFKGYAAFWGLLVTVCDFAWLTPWQKRLRASAARIQELFDCDVLQLPWDELKAGRKPGPEMIRENADRYRKRASDMPPLTDWYPKEVGGLPLHIARLICQRSNCWWDAKQRRRYAVTILAIVAIVAVTVLLLAMRGGLTIEDFILKVAVPLSPVVLLGCRQFTEQIEAAARLDKLKQHAESLWDKALAGALEAEVTSGSRRLQDEILESRTRSPLVFDAIFKQLRHDYEAQMNYGATELVAEAEKQIG